jgi:hypothetical protein
MRPRTRWRVVVLAVMLLSVAVNAFLIFVITDQAKYPNSEGSAYAAVALFVWDLSFIVFFGVEFWPRVRSWFKHRMQV